MLTSQVYSTYLGLRKIVNFWNKKDLTQIVNTNNIESCFYGQYYLNLNPESYMIKHLFVDGFDSIFGFEVHLLMDIECFISNILFFLFGDRGNIVINDWIQECNGCLNLIESYLIQKRYPLYMSTLNQ